jgi:MFS family permease
MWSTSFYLGNFLGPTIAGFLVDAFGFRSASIVFFAAFLVIIVVDFIELGYNINLSRNKRSAEYEELS